VLDPDVWDRGPVLPRLAVEWGSQDDCGQETVLALERMWEKQYRQQTVPMPAIYEKDLVDTRSDLPVIADAATVAFQAPRGRHAR
jgi:hypothetical protein